MYNILYPITLSNPFGTQGYKLNINMYKIENATLLKNLEGGSTVLTEIIQKAEVVQHVDPLLIIKINKHKEAFAKSTLGIVRSFKGGEEGIFLDLCTQLKEPAWKLNLLTEIQVTVGEPFVVRHPGKEYEYYENRAGKV